MLKILHIGAGRNNDVMPGQALYFGRNDCIHLGEGPHSKEGDAGCAKKQWKKAITSVHQYGLLDSLNLASKRIKRFLERRKVKPTDVLEGIRITQWYYQKGDRLPFDSGSFDAIYSEHFLEHIYADEARLLMMELSRVTRKGGVVRTSVPDADLRIYEKPEKVGFPTIKMSFDHPSKHKTRWSVYSLTDTKVVAGLLPVPVVYCDRQGAFVEFGPKRDEYPPDIREEVFSEFVDNADYIRRKLSLIVDGVKVK